MSCLLFFISIASAIDCQVRGCLTCENENKCSECREDRNFKKEPNSDGRCICKEDHLIDNNYYIDNYLVDESKFRCIPFFPNSCQEGCFCDSNNIEICSSCQQGYIPEYGSDGFIRQCVETKKCPPENDGCQSCSKNGECLLCKEGYYFSISTSKCIQGTPCKIYGCAICSTDDKCEACFPEFPYHEGKGRCDLKTIYPKNIIYADLNKYKDDIAIDQEQIIQETSTSTIINLKNIRKDKERAYYYTHANTDTLYINNDNSIPFRIDFVYQAKEITIKRMNNAISDPLVILYQTSGMKFNIQTSNISLYDCKSTCTLSSDKDEIQLDKITAIYAQLTLNIDKNMKINEVDVYTNFHGVNSIDFEKKKDNIQVSISKLYLHQKSKLDFRETIDVDTLIIESESKLSFPDATIKNIVLNIYTASLGDYLAMIDGTIKGEPESIKLNMNPPNKALYDLSSNVPGVIVASGYNFKQNCDKWAKLYNDNPTDEIYNYAVCSHDEKRGLAALEIRHHIPSPTKKKESIVGAVVGIVIGSVVGIGIIVFLLVYFLVIKKRKNKNNNSSEKEGEMDDDQVENAM